MKKYTLLVCLNMLIIFGSVFIFKSCSNDLTEPALKEAYKDHFKIGAALGKKQVMNIDSGAVEIVKKHFNTITPENDLKWERVHPEPGKYSFEDPDRFVDLGKQYDMHMVGHTLVWHNQTPDWVFLKDTSSLASREMLLKRMKEHISTVVGRYRGQVNAWDVVNEALTEDGELRSSRWLDIIGADYIQKAFEFANETDPKAELYYNDYNLYKPSKRDGAVKLVKSLQASGVKIDGIGMQAHYGLDDPDIDQVEASIKAFAELGIKVMITELDISVLPFPTSEQSAEISVNYDLRKELDPFTEAVPEDVQMKFNHRYLQLFELFLKHSDKIDRVTFWGVHDGHSWKNNWPVKGRTDYPLLFDREYQEKKVIDQIIDLTK